MNGAAQALLILAVIALFFAVVVMPMLARILNAPQLGSASDGAAPWRAGGIDPGAFAPPPYGVAPSSAHDGNSARSTRGQPARAMHSSFDLDDQGNDESDLAIDIDRVRGRLKSGSVNKIVELIDRHPQAAAGVLRTWLKRTD